MPPYLLRSRYFLPERIRGDWLPRTAEVAPEQEGFAGRGKWGEVGAKLFVEGAGLLRGDFVLHGDVGAELLAILRGEPGPPAVRQIRAYCDEFRCCEAVGDAASEEEDAAGR